MYEKLISESQVCKNKPFTEKCWNLGKIFNQVGIYYVIVYRQKGKTEVIKMLEYLLKKRVNGIIGRGQG